MAKLALQAKIDDIGTGSVFRKLTYPIGHRRFAKNPNPASKAQFWLQMEFCDFPHNTTFFGEECNRLLGKTRGEESLDFIEKDASERLGAVRLRKVQQKINRYRLLR